MHFSISAILTLGLSALSFSSASQHPSDLFKRADALRPVIEKRVPNQPFKNEQLEKRASPFLTSKTKKFAVDGSAIPDVNVRKRKSMIHPVSQTTANDYSLRF